MSYWYQIWDKVSPSNNNDIPPDGAPEGMAPSTVNNTIRQMMSAIKELGGNVFQDEAAGGPPHPDAGAPYYSTGLLNVGLAQRIYDEQWPVNSIRMWHPGVGAAAADPNAALVATGSSIVATWALCDGTGDTPNLTNRLPQGTHTGNANSGTEYPVAPLDVSADPDWDIAVTLPDANQSGSHSHGTARGGFDGSTEDHELTTNQLSEHSHGYNWRPETFSLNQGSGAQVTQVWRGGSDTDYNRQTNVKGGNGTHYHGINNDGAHTHTIDATTADIARTAIQYWMRTV